jgi:hypothetical protein
MLKLVLEMTSNSQTHLKLRGQIIKNSLKILLYNCCIAGCRVQFPNDLACVLANCDHYSALLGLLTLEFALFFLRVGIKK